MITEKSRSNIARLAVAAAIAAAATAANAASFHILLTPTVDGKTQMTFSASGHTDGPGGGSDFTWANLVGGDPFDASLQFFDVDVDPIQTQSGIQLIGLTLDSDGNTAVGQDDLTLRFDRLVFMEDSLTTAEAIRLLDLDFALLTPGEYSRVTSAGDLNLMILASPVPLPASAPLMLAGLALLAGVRRLSNKRA